MQETNNENTQPTRPQSGADDDAPTQPNPALDETMPIRPNAGIEQTLPVRPNLGAEETMPTRVQPAAAPPAVRTTAKEPTLPVTPSAVQPVPKKVKRHRWPWVLLGIFCLVLFAAAGGWFGYQAAIQLRKARMDEQRVTIATEHFMLGMQAQAKKQYEIARQQFEYVIRLDASFPGAADKLREVMIAMAVVNTPTPAPTTALPTLTPTLDTRPQDEIFNQAKAQYAAKDWNGLFGSIDSLRRIDPKYKAVEIDDMLYMALRYRGVDKILHQANLEGGLYDLALAEQFGPLDVDALGYRNWARLYLNGSTFWEIDWLKVVEAFEQIYPYFPNMRDSSGLTAIERYRIAARNYADQLMEKDDPCKAYDYYKKSLNAVADPEVENKANAAYLKCYPPTATPTLTPVPATAEPTQPIVEPSPTTEAPAPPPPPTETPTVTPTPTATTATGG